jgi:hypothetical protein
MSTPYPSRPHRPIYPTSPYPHSPSHVHGGANPSKTMQGLCGVFRRARIKMDIEVDEREYEKAVIDERPGQ